MSRPFWDYQVQLTLKLGVLKHFESVEKLVFRSLKCAVTAIPMEAITQNYTRLTALVINNCKFTDKSDSNRALCLPTSWVTAITKMTQLRKLDLEKQLVAPENCNYIADTMTYLTQLRVSSECGVRKSALNRLSASGLKKLVYGSHPIIF